MFFLGHMPEVSRFLGIIVSFYYDDHNPPHFHVKYNEHRATFLIHELQIQRGSLPKKVIALVLEWAYEHREELMDNWQLAQEGKEPNKIEPLV
jgi:hypothetical protein